MRTLPDKLDALLAGPAPETAAATLLLLHGRGGSAQDMLGLHDELDLDDVAAVALQAPGGTWYPHSFLAPREANQPKLDTSLGGIESAMAQLAGRGVQSDRVVLLGFSQGACLALEFAASHPRRYGAVVALTGGLIGQELRRYGKSLEGTPVFLGTSDPDPHVPYQRVLETNSVLIGMGAKVDLRRYPGMPHTINTEELQATRVLLLSITGRYEP